jgi:hypothetical protein
VRVVPFTLKHDSPILLQGNTLARLSDSQTKELKATYQAGYSIMLLAVNMAHINALHAIVGIGMTYRSKDTALLLAYAVRRENFIPTTTLVTRLDPSPLQTPNGDPVIGDLRKKLFARWRDKTRSFHRVLRLASAKTSSA